MNKTSINQYLRFLAKNKLFTAISIIGLGVGIASCLLISMYIQYESNFDQYHAKKDRIYRLTSELDFNGKINAALTNLPSAPALKEDYPEVESYVRFRRFGQEAQIKVEQQMHPTPDVWFCDSTVFDVFSYPLVSGNPESALTQPNSIVLTETTAKQLFGETNPLNQSLYINNSVFQVTGVMMDPPAQSEMPINALVSMNTLPPQFMATFNQDWFRIGFLTFILFNEPVDVAQFEEKMIAFEKKYVQPWSAENQIEASLTYALTPLNELHFDTGRTYDLPKGNKMYLLIFGILAIFLMIIALINYLNLNLALSGKRSKEIGIRKAAGAYPRDIFKQFVSESFILSTLALVFGLLLLAILLPSFNTTIQAELSMATLLTPSFFIPMLVLFIVVTFLANSYPAMLLSRLNPIIIFRGSTGNGNKLSKLNQSLLFVQFLFSLFMISATLLVQKQMDYIADYSLGFEKDKILTLQIPSDTTVRNQLIPWMETIENETGVIATSKTRMPEGNTSGELMFRIEQNEKMVEQTVNFLFVDDHFIDVMGLDFIAGRNFDPNIATDQQQAFIINEKAAETFGWYGDALNKRVQWGLMPNGQAQNDGVVVGVVKNFNFQSLHNNLEPLILCFNPRGGNSLAIRYNSAELQAPIQALQAKWTELAPGFPMQYSVLSTSIDDNYQGEQQMKTVLQFFSFIAIILSLVGLFALVSVTLQARTKEIGIRKVLGASTSNLLWLVSKNFWILLTISFLICTPIAWWFISNWLNDFAYHISINLMPFITSFIALGLLSAITIAYHVWRISQVEPVKALRHE